VPSLESVRERIVGCERCLRLRSYCRRVGEVKKLAYRDQEYWARPVPGFGDPEAEVLVIGLAPAAHGANRTGRVFTGDGTGGSGDFLMRAMHASGFASLPFSRSPDDGLTLTGAFISSAVRCAPPDNKPSPGEIAACHDHLVDEAAALRRIRVLVCLGRIGFDAAWRLLDSRGIRVRPRPRFAHGAIYHPAEGLSVIASYHPSRQNTNTGRLTPLMLARVFERAKVAASSFPLPAAGPNSSSWADRRASPGRRRLPPLP
jgi:uracil-DNA glycosylase family 4